MMATTATRSSSDSGILCDICQKSNIDDKDIPIATHYCTNCNENQCSKCSEFHGKLNATKNHKLVNIDGNVMKTFDSLELFKKDCYQNRKTPAEQQEHLEDPVHDDFPSDVQEQVKNESDSGIENKHFEEKLRENIKKSKNLAPGLQESRIETAKMGEQNLEKNFDRALKCESLKSKFEELGNRNLEKTLQESRKEIAEMKEQNRILKENFDKALDRENNLKKELDAIKSRRKSGIFGNVREAFDTTLKSNKPLRRHTRSSSDMSVSIYERKLSRLSSCCICSMILQDNRMTPCFHIVCLKCLENIHSKAMKQPGELLPCPFCGKTFTIPSKGMTGLQTVLFAENPIDILKSFSPKYESTNNYCKTHCGKALDYYCKDCDTVVCVSCFVENHKFHDCKDVTTIDKDFRRTLEEIIKKLSGQKQEMLSRRLDMERLMEEFLAKSFETSKEIKNKIDTLKSLIDQHAQTLLDELSTIKQKHQANMEKEIDDIETNTKLLDSFLTFCTQTKVKGSANDLCRCGYNLITTAKELSKENEEYLHTPSKLVEIKFIATHQDDTILVGAKVIGKLSVSSKLFESKVFVFGIDDGVSITNDVIEINLNQSNDVSKAQKMPVQMIRGSAAAVHCDSIFVTGIGKKCDEIWRFKATSSKWKKCASLVEGRRRHSVAFVDHILYICGGWVNSKQEALDDVEAYDTLKDKCVTVGKLVNAHRSSGNCVPFKSSLYIFGGCDANGEKVNKVQVYDTKLNKCALLSKPMPISQSLLQAALWENTVILLGCNSFFTYNFETKVWEVRDRFKTDTEYFGLTISNGLVFVIGGGDTKEDADGNEKWICRDDVRCVPVVNILNDEPIEWKHHAKLLKPSLVHAFGQMDFF